MRLIPHSNGAAEESQFREHNSCHSPDDGKFCSGIANPRTGIMHYLKRGIAKIRPKLTKAGRFKRARPRNRTSTFQLSR